MKDIVRRQYRDRVEKARSVGMPTIPPEGWIRTLRKALGMSSPQLAARLGLSRGQVTKMERMEPEGRITLKQLRRVGEALDCELVYALIPRQPIRDMVRRQAEKKARALVGRADVQMKLESQQLPEDELQALIADEVERLLREEPGYLWDE